ncbi:uncharacterized protein SPSK_09634 [Sporothrix schenckii 1099-18]|uniref:Uncharacterized protein n=1 Tax=Sporothrix schenckii 1099-18 TaxID=1397361 RepID=A0A0F2M575_SPOSC|nr:uncharacterized protein SPSK_09634 [Sporothrix schenckii 1099-18]KJR84858.1 hypothetical protein SPSK_09634 [Sporothrix schenckii 1099-18]
MGLLQIKIPPSLTPPLTGSPPQGTVDRLATFFLGKFQETKKESDLATLQCTAQLKFEALEKTLEEQTLTVTELRHDMKSEIQSEIESFRDKAASYFLDKFSGQLDALGARRGEKSELAISRLEHRVDDEVKNLSDQLSDLSTKVAISNAAVNATIDDIRKKVSSGNDVSAENLRRCESEFRSRLSRLENLIESSKTEATIERDKVTRVFQDANKRLQSKVDGLELSIMRQSEELTKQSEKIHRLESELRTLSQLGMGQENAHTTVMKMLSIQREELSRLAQSVREQTNTSSVKERASKYEEDRTES